MGKFYKVILDTNFLFVPLQLRIDIFDEIQRILPGAKLFVLSESLKEAEKVDSRALPLIKKMLATYNVEVIPSEGGVDRCLLEKAKKGYIIATNDSALRKKVKRSGGRTIFVRGLKKLLLE